MSKKKKEIEEDKQEEQIKDLMNKLSESGMDDNTLKLFESKLKERLKEHKNKHIFRSILIYLFFAVLLFCVNLAAFGFLSSFLYVESWSRGLIYILSVTIISLILTLVEKGFKLIPGFLSKVNVYVVELIKPLTLFILMLIANYTLNYVVFNHWYGILCFLAISYTFQFAITYYRIKHQITKLF